VFSWLSAVVETGDISFFKKNMCSVLAIYYMNFFNG
jgi:hypothetical protein